MQVNINTLSEVLHEAEITLTPDELEPHFERAYNKERARIEIKGFRKGKAPLDMIKRMYGEAIEHDVLDRLANDFYTRAMDERKINPIGQPALVDMDYRRGEQFRFRIQYETRPEIRLREYKGISVVRPVHNVTEDDIEHELHRLRRMSSTTSPAQSVMDDECIVTVDVQELDAAGTPIIGRKTRGMTFYLADETLSDRIKASLKNALIGGTYRVHFEPSPDGKGASSVDLQVTGIEKVNLPPLDQDLVSKLSGGKVASVEAFREQTRTDLERHWKDWSERKLADAIMAELVRLHSITVPESLVSTILDSFLEDLKSRSRNRELPADFDEEKFRSESRELAVWQAKWFLIKEQIAEAERITVEEGDIEEAATTDVERSGLPKAKLVEFYSKSAGARERILSSKIMKFLAAHASITDKIVEPQHQN
jgi:trigger factor